jgi:hypothetical protein
MATTIYLKSQTKHVAVEETVTEIAKQLSLIQLPGLLVLSGYDKRMIMIDVEDISVVMDEGPE